MPTLIVLPVVADVAATEETSEAVAVAVVAAEVVAPPMAPKPLSMSMTRPLSLPLRRQMLYTTLTSAPLLHRSIILQAHVWCVGLNRLEANTGVAFMLYESDKNLIRTSCCFRVLIPSSTSLSATSSNQIFVVQCKTSASLAGQLSPTLVAQTRDRLFELPRG